MTGPSRRRSDTARTVSALATTALVGALVIVSPWWQSPASGTGGGGRVLIDDSFAFSTSSSDVQLTNNGTTGFPCLTAGSLVQTSPATLAVTAGDSGSFTTQLTTEGGSGSISFALSVPTPAISVTGTGAVSTMGSLAIGDYTVSGTDTDGTGGTGKWTFTLHVTPGADDVVQQAPAAGLISTATSGGFADQLATTGGTGSVTFTTTAPSAALSVSSTGKVSTTGSLAVGVYSVSGTDAGATSGVGLWSYTLHVKAATSSVRNCGAGTPDADGDGALELTRGGTTGTYEASNVIYDGSFPTADGLTITFDTYMYDSDPFGAADGISFDLASAPPVPLKTGVAGGGLAYSTTGTGSPGLPGGYLGIGLDEYGNYSNPTYEGKTCLATSPPWVGFSPNEVAVHGPGDGTSGYCLLSSSVEDSPDPLGATGPIHLHGNTRTTSEITVHIAIDTVTDPSHPTYSVYLQPVGDSSPTLVTTGPLPDYYYDPTNGQRIDGVPPQLSFAIAASTGSGTDVHEISNLDTRTETGAALTTLTLAKTDNLTTHVASVGVPFDYLLTPGVATGSAAPEDDTVTLTDQLPATEKLTAEPTGTGWDCTTSDLATSTVRCTYTPSSPVPAAATLPTVTVPAVVTYGYAEAGETNTAFVSSDDSLGFAQDSDTITDSFTTPLLDASVGDSDEGSVPIDTPDFTLTFYATVNTPGTPEADPISISAMLPTSLLLRASPSGTGWDCGASSGQKVTCTYRADTTPPEYPLSPQSATTSLTVPVKLVATDTVGQKITVSDEASSSDAAPWWAPATATDVLTVVPSVGLELSETDSGSPPVGDPEFVDGGTPFTYTLSVAVTGMSAERDPIHLTETAPTGVGLTAVPKPLATPHTYGSWDCTATDVSMETITCVFTVTTPGGIPTGTSLPTVVVPEFLANTTTGTEVKDTSPRASSADAGTVSASDVFYVTRAPVQLDFTLGDDAGAAVSPGATFDYLATVKVDNAGTAEDQPITVTDPLPGGTALRSTDPPHGASSGPDGGSWTCLKSLISTFYSAYYVDCTYTPLASLAPGTVLPTIVEPAVATGSVTGATVRNTAQAGSADAGRRTASVTVTITTGALTETTPFTGTVAANAESGFSVQLRSSNSYGSETFTVTTSVSGITVSSTGRITVATLPVGTYTLKGTDTDSLTDAGTWTYALTVTAGTITQVAPISPIPSVPSALTVPSSTQLPPSTHTTTTPGVTLSHPTVAPGQSTTMSGFGCTPGHVVTVSLGGRVIGTTVANTEGAFSVSINPETVPLGQTTVTASCGSTTLAALLSSVATSTLSSPETSAGVCGVFILLALILLRGQFGTNGSRRRRKRLGAGPSSSPS